MMVIGRNAMNSQGNPRRGKNLLQNRAQLQNCRAISPNQKIDKSKM